MLIPAHWYIKKEFWGFPFLSKTRQTPDMRVYFNHNLQLNPVKL